MNQQSSARALDILSPPIAGEFVERLAAGGLRIALLDTADREAFGVWLQAEARGFHDGLLPHEVLADLVEAHAHRRTTGVWDGDEPEPVGTVNSWAIDLTVPGGRSVPSWAISAVSVAPTHRRRGIARTLLEDELRVADDLGLPVAILTVSESTIYGRFGFGPAAMTADWTIDTRRSTWTGPEVPSTGDAGTLRFIPLAELDAIGLELVQRVRLATPGQIDYDGFLWQRITAQKGNRDAAKSLRAVVFRDGEGVLQGFAVFKLLLDPLDYTNHTLDVSHLVSATDEAYAALWRFLLEMDLVGKLSVALRPTDEPVRWMVNDFRRVTKVEERDHLWTRILDVPAALEARSYASPASLVLEVTDSLGYAAGTFRLEANADGTAVVTTSDAAADVTLTVNALSSLYLGGVSALTLAHAGQLVEHRAGALIELDRTFRSPVVPWLSIWF